jgi:hypothetical protein
MNAQAPAASPPPRPLKRWLPTALHALTILAVVAGFVALRWVDTMPRRVDDQQTIVVGQTRLVPDSDASVRVVVQDFGAGKPIVGAHVKVSLKPDRGQAVPLFEGQTDESGSLPVRFRVPADAPAEAQLVVETESAVGRDRVEQPVTVQREYRLLLTSDKPLYQPGQTIHMRALALSTARRSTSWWRIPRATRSSVRASRPPTSAWSPPTSRWPIWSTRGTTN